MAFLTRNRVRIHVSGPGFDEDIRWTEHLLGGSWRADKHVKGEWVPAREWDAHSRTHLGLRFRELHRLQAG